mmetsp:Transcript_43781/g.52960  ORF Transcript_43781/g.52960 Transcript_43781/m.52960 type:complete len:157 (+) Transcript_43781:322-792(+)
MQHVSQDRRCVQDHHRNTTVNAINIVNSINTMNTMNTVTTVTTMNTMATMTGMNSVQTMHIKLWVHTKSPQRSGPLLVTDRLPHFLGPQSSISGFMDLNLRVSRPQFQGLWTSCWIAPLSSIWIVSRSLNSVSFMLTSLTTTPPGFCFTMYAYDTI